jgi:peptidoglycan/LPS O-acetylase OafA/YrhL
MAQYPDVGLHVNLLKRRFATQRCESSRFNLVHGMTAHIRKSKARPNWIMLSLAILCFLGAVAAGWLGQHNGLSWPQYYLAPALALLSALLVIPPGGKSSDDTPDPV